MAVASMAVISPSLTVCISVPLPVLLRGCTAYYGQHIRHWMGRQLVVLARSTHVAMERFGGISTVISFSQRCVKERQYSDIIEASYGFMRRVAIHKGVFWGSSLLGSHQVLGGEILPDHLIITPLCKRISASGDKSEGGGGAVPAEEAGLTSNAATGGCSYAIYYFFSIQQQVEDLQNAIPTSSIESRHFVKQVNSNVGRIALVPAACQRKAGKKHELGNRRWVNNC